MEGGKTEALPVSGVPGAPVFPPADISRDERRLSTFITAHEEATKDRIALMDIADLKAPFRLVEIDPRIVANGVAAGEFTPDGAALVYVIRGENNADNLWLQPLDGKAGRQLTHFNGEQIFSYTYSPDGKRLLIERGHLESDVVLLRDTSR